MKKLSLIVLLTLSIVFPSDKEKKAYPATNLELDGKVYVAFEYPNPATNVVDALIHYELYKAHYELSKDVIKDQVKVIKLSKKSLRREKIRRVLTFIGVGFAASSTGFVTGYVFKTFR